MASGLYGWNTDIDMFQQHSVFLESPVPATSNYGVLNLGGGAFDGLRPGHFSGYVGGNYLTFNTVSGEFSYLIYAQAAGNDVFTLSSAGNVVARGVHSVLVDGSSATIGALNVGNGQFLGQAGNFAGVVAGTEFAINAASGFTGNLADFQVGGSRFANISAVATPNTITDARFYANVTTQGYILGTVLGTMQGGIYAAPTTNGFQLGTASAHGFILFTNNINRMVIDNAGEVGISSADATGVAVSGQDVTIKAGAATNRPLVVKGNTSQSGDLQQWQDVNNNVLSSVDSKGHLNLKSPTDATSFHGTLNLGDGPFDGITSGFFNTTSSAGTVLAINAASGYLGHLIEVQIAGTRLFTVYADGSLNMVGSLILGGSLNLSAQPDIQALEWMQVA